jgi:NAD(P)-dependent dehydrogenase (short-subunit alcohol dehydrogenase family)
VHILPADMSDHASLTSAASGVAALTPSVDHLIINGAYLSVASYPLTGPDYIGREDLFLSELHSAMQTNAAGTLFSINAFMPLILKSDIKKIVAISSAGGDIDAVRDMDMADALPYALSKAGVNMLVAKYALKYRAQGVVCVAMNPGFVYTLSESLDTSNSPFSASLPYTLLVSLLSPPIPVSPQVWLVLIRNV